MWFNATNTACALGYLDTRDAIRVHVNKTDTMQLKFIESDDYIHWVHPHTLYLSEPGFHSIMFRSRMPAAKTFADWISRQGNSLGKNIQ